MFVVNDDLSIYATRGDIVCLNVSATDDRTGKPYEFQPGDVLQMKIYTKKNAEEVVLQKDFPVVAKTDVVGVVLTEADTKIGDVISKPVDYWYEVTLNPYTNPQTFIGYDEDGAKIFKLFPEGKDIRTDEPTKPEDIPVVDVDLSLTSSRPVENKAIARAITLLKNDLTMVDERLTGKIKENKESTKDLTEQLAIEKARIDNLLSGATADGSEVVDIRVGADGATYGSAGGAVRGVESIANIGLSAFSAVADKDDVVFEPLKGFYRGKDFFALDMYTSALLSCEKGDIFYVTSVVNADTNLALALFFDADMEFISYYKQSEGIAPEAYESEPVIVSSAKFKYVCFTSLGDLIVSKAVFNGNKRLKAIEEKVGEIDGLLNFESEASHNLAVVNTAMRNFEDVALELKLGFYRVNDYMSLDQYTTAVIPCEKGDIFKVSTIVNASANLALASFYTEDMTFIEYYKQNNDGGKAIAYKDELVHVPVECAFMVVTCPTESVDRMKVSKITDEFISVAEAKSDIDNSAPMIALSYRDRYNLQRRDALTNSRKKLSEGNLNYTILGDSITDTYCGHASAGGGASAAEYGYPQVLHRWLKERYGDGVTFTNNGTGGNSVSDAYAVINEQIVANNYDMVGVALGTNDWNRQTNLTQFYNNYKALLDKLLSDTTAEIFLIGLGYFATWSPGKAVREHEYNAVIQRLAKEYDIPYVDTYHGMRAEVAMGGYTFEDMTLASDPVHPNDFGHRIWATEVFRLFD